MASPLTRAVTVDVHQPQSGGGGTITQRYFRDAGSFTVSDGYLHISSPDGIIAIFPPGDWHSVSYGEWSATDLVAQYDDPLLEIRSPHAAMARRPG